MSESSVPVEARRASTVLVLRPGETGVEVFMVQRNRKTGFMPHAWVFPGGRVDEEDSLSDLPAQGGEEGISAMGIASDDARAFMVAAVRETYEETGIWLGTGRMDENLRDQLMGRNLTFLDALKRGGGVMDLSALIPWSWWVTPKIEPRRYDTRFFLTIVPANAGGRHDIRESVDSCWITPSDALERAARGQFPLAPPTWWSLKELDALGELAAIQQAGRDRSPRAIQPMLEVDASGEWELKLPGHPEHPEPPIAGLPHSVRFDQGRWWASETA